MIIAMSSIDRSTNLLFIFWKPGLALKTKLWQFMRVRLATALVKHLPTLRQFAHPWYVTVGEQNVLETTFACFFRNYYEYYTYPVFSVFPMKSCKRLKEVMITLYLNLTCIVKSLKHFQGIVANICIPCYIFIVFFIHF